MSAATAAASRSRGAPLDARNPREAIGAGIAMVMQETSLAPDLSVLENIFLPELGAAGQAAARRAAATRARHPRSLGQHEALPLDHEVRRLSVAQRQLVEIAKALARRRHADHLRRAHRLAQPGRGGAPVRRDDAAARRPGTALVFVSHRLEEVFAITDRVTVMREGRTVAALARDIGSLSQSRASSG